jgi:GT2 family glycosyltransferase
MIRVSVVVPTFQRAAFLEACLDALTQQTLAPSDYEVIVADDAASIDTRLQVRRWVGPELPTITYVRVTGAHGPAAARNAGWRAARAPVVAFTDDDTIPMPDWLERALASFGDTTHAAWGAVCVPLPPHPTDYERDVAGLQHAGFVTANCFVRRDVLEAIGGFDESFRAAWREDSDLFFRLLEQQCSIRHLPDATVIHPVRPAKWGVSVAQQRKAEFDALLYRKHRELYRIFVRPGRPWLYYPIVLALGVMIAGALARSRAVTMAGATVWLALTMTFAARRLRGTSRAPSHVAEMLVTSALIPMLSLYHRVRGAVKHRVLFW